MVDYSGLQWTNRLVGLRIPTEPHGINGSVAELVQSGEPFGNLILARSCQDLRPFGSFQNISELAFCRMNSMAPECPQHIDPAGRRNQQALCNPHTRLCGLHTVCKLSTLNRRPISWHVHWSLSVSSGPLTCYCWSTCWSISCAIKPVSKRNSCSVFGECLSVQQSANQQAERYASGASTDLL